MENMEEKNVEQKEREVVRYSGFWVRWAARIIDCIILSIAIIPLTSIFGLINIIPWMGFFTQAILIFIGVAVAWTYYIVMTDRYQATLGKMAVGAIVVGEKNAKLTIHNVVMRETLGKFISGIICNIGFLIAAFTAKKQGLHDFIGKSYVVYKDPAAGPNKGVVATVYVLFGLFISISLIVFSSIFLLIFALTMMAGDSEYSGDFPLNGFEQEMMLDEGSFDDFLEETPV